MLKSSWLCFFRGMSDRHLSVWMPSNFFRIDPPPTVSVRFSRNFVHVVCMPIRIKLQNIFSKC